MTKNSIYQLYKNATERNNELERKLEFYIKRNLELEDKGKEWHCSARIAELERIHAIDTEYIERSQTNDERLCARIKELEQKVQDMLMANMTMVKLLEKKHALIDEAVDFVTQLKCRHYSTTTNSYVNDWLDKVRGEK